MISTIVPCDNKHVEFPVIFCFLGFGFSVLMMKMNQVQLCTLQSVGGTELIKGSAGDYFGSLIVG